MSERRSNPKSGPREAAPAALRPQWLQTQAALRDLAESAAEAACGELSECARVLGDLLEIALGETVEGGSPRPELQELVAFVEQQAPPVLAAVDGEGPDAAALRQTVGQAVQRWGDALQLLPAQRWADEACGVAEADRWSDASNPGEESRAELPSASDQLKRMLSVLALREDEPVGEADEAHAPPPAQAAEARPASTSAARAPRSAIERGPTAPPQPAEEANAIQQLRADADLRDAFLDDAHRCLAAMEQLVLASESSHRGAQDTREFCRELHTLKGASASVGLAHLSAYVHEVEELVERRAAEADGMESEFLLGVIDAIRRHIAGLQPAGAVPAERPLPASAARHAAAGASAAPAPPAPLDGEDAQASIRVRASKLDRLMDMLAELVVLRNHRETQVGELNRLNRELEHCAARLRQFGEQLADHERAHRFQESAAVDTPTGLLGCEMASTRAVSEVAADLMEIARGIGEVHRPIGEENVALSHFIRQFRQELMQLRRLPITGLFRRLQRAVRDAARVEGKAVQMQLFGQQTGLEQSLQEQLYEPLLHIVRNAVSHGIETETIRRQRGKTPAGTIGLHISATANLLAIAVHDDGRGLDFDAIRRKGYDRGLLSPDRSPTTAELARLIFHPGFSTRDEANAVSGRGVGMDVVVSAIDRLHGRIEVDSQPGQGTTIRLSIPLRAGIEHTMAVRAGGQLLAFPLYAVRAAQTAEGADKGVREDSAVCGGEVSLAEVLGLPRAESGSQQRRLQLDAIGEGSRESATIALRVDDIVGGEEVVVRAVPRLLQRHPLLGGVSLSGGAEMVLLLDPRRLYEYCLRHGGREASRPLAPTATPAVRPAAARRVLVVDDSMSARMNLVKRLQRRGFETVEAIDGIEALERLNRECFHLVLTDLDMPRLGGLELLSEIRQREWVDAPVVVVTSRNSAEIRRQASRYGARGFMNKPVTDERLQELLEPLGLAESSPPLEPCGTL